MKNCKTFYETQTASNLQEMIHSSPRSLPSDKILLHLWNKHFLTEIYRNIQTFAFKVLQECSSWGVKKWYSANVFSDTKQKHFCWKIFEDRKVFGCIVGRYYFQCQVS